MGVPQNGWLIRGNPIKMRMMTGGTPMTQETTILTPRMIFRWFLGCFLPAIEALAMLLNYSEKLMPLALDAVPMFAVRGYCNRWMV